MIFVRIETLIINNCNITFDCNNSKKTKFHDEFHEAVQMFEIRFKKKKNETDRK